MVARCLRNPVVHFVVMGGILFGLSLAVRSSYKADQLDRPRFERKPIVISAERIRLFQSDFLRKWRSRPTKAQLKALIAETVENEMLYREARLLALDFKDRSVRRRLIEKMRAVGDRKARTPDELYKEALALGFDDDIVIRRLLIEKMRILLQQDLSGGQLRERQVRSYVEQNRQRFLQPPTVTFSHIFLSEKRGNGIEGEAKALLAQLRSDFASVDIAARLSDPFPLGLKFRAYPKSRIAARFGKRFAEQVFGLDMGAWIGPIESPYGLHFVRIDEKQPPQMPPLRAIWGQAASQLAKQRAAKRLKEGLSRLRSLYEVRIENDEKASVIGEGQKEAS